MYIVTNKKDSEKVGIQRLLHPLGEAKGKFMSKLYEIPTKHLIQLHRPQIPVIMDSHLEKTKSTDAITQVKEWNPIDPRFYSDDVTDDEEPLNKNDTIGNIKIDYNDERELEWDSDQFNIQLGHTPNIKNDSDIALEPRQLFTEDENHSDVATLTQESSDDNVFFTPNHRGNVQNTNLKRRNAIRQNRNMIRSEPRVTRHMVRTDRYPSTSIPNTPAEVVTNQRQNLRNVLQRRTPLVPASVNMDGSSVQILDRALAAMTREAPPGRLRRQARVDYKHLHRLGRENV